MIEFLLFILLFAFWVALLVYSFHYFKKRQLSLLKFSRISGFVRGISKSHSFSTVVKQYSNNTSIETSSSVTTEFFIQLEDRREIPIKIGGSQPINDGQILTLFSADEKMESEIFSFYNHNTEQVVDLIDQIKICYSYPDAVIVAFHLVPVMGIFIQTGSFMAVFASLIFAIPLFLLTKLIIKDSNKSDFRSLSSIEVNNFLLDFELVRGIRTALDNKLNKAHGNTYNTIVLGDQIITNTNNYEIQLTIQEQSFIKTELEDALKQMQVKIASDINSEIRKSFEDLKAELNRPSPRPRILRSAFEVLKKLNTGSELIEIFNTISKGIEIFS